MFELLVECRPQGAREGALRGGVASIVLHSALIAGAVAATMQTAVRTADPHPEVGIVYLEPPDRIPAPPLLLAGAVFSTPTVGAPTLAISAIIPSVIPPPSEAPFDPLGFGRDPGPAASSATPDTATVGPGGVYAARLVDEAPVLLTHPAVAYPELLREAGIGGRTMVEAIIDTTGRVEPGSVRVVTAAHQLLVRPAVDVVAASVYRPGRVDGRAVRVRVRVPVDFQVGRRASSM